MTMPYEADEELLEYETEQEDPEPTAPAAPIPVCVREPVVTVPTVPQHLTCRTFVLTDGTPVQILAQDPYRVRAQVVVKGNDVVLCHSLAQAQDPGNVDPTLTRPNGTILPTGLPAVVIESTQAAWLVANTFPTRVGLIVERRS